MKTSNRLEGLKSAVFAELDEIKEEVAAGGLSIIDLSIGSPDMPPMPHIFHALQEAIDDLDNYGYPSSRGTRDLRETISWWYGQRFGVQLDPETEVLVLMGSQDGLGHMPLCLLDPGDIALVPDPGYPIYTAGVILAGGEVYHMPLKKENQYLPDFEKIPEDIAKRANMMILNYPNNPVAAVADSVFFDRVVEFASRYDIVVCHDVAYSELSFDGYRPPSFLESEGAIKVGVEFHSVSKTYNMAGCRLGFVVGNSEVIEALTRVKSNIDYGVFLPIQMAGITALRGPQDIIRRNAAAYKARRDILIDGLAKIGWVMDKPQATMFVWAPLPKGYTSSEKFAEDILRQTGVAVVPGVAFGRQGEGYVRIALVQDNAIIQEAVRRISDRFSF
ncbi:LL-diaminopimelate aminotransferase [Phosphitispora fastidiosa]|uniref:LL-diaminopimelate aminotransferase n=1 Tax=Phosphitispora fastidiosa TaxID=2837202 RepID=UPI001E4F8762|nr:LL-diaminopimelate aminotransferase [Phosphitispora fastidiosa]MBU7005244.1 LL-diaminopimelate aminotransferase [Phosphitispora fastidiosa]